MNDPSDNTQSKKPESRQPVYVLPQDAGQALIENEIDIVELWRYLWSRKFIVVGITVAVATLFATYALVAKEWYRSEVLLAPVEQTTTASLGGQLGGLAALAGLGGGRESSIEAVATLRSREFARDFVRDRDLLKAFFAEDWDFENDRWQTGATNGQPDMRDGVTYFHENVLRVGEDRRTGLVTLAIEWVDASEAAEWAADLVRRLNDRLRIRALTEAEVNVSYLQGEMAKTNVITLQQSIGRLLETELQKLMLARGNEEFAFRVIDHAIVPKRPDRPKRLLIVASGFIIGGLLAVVVVLVGRGAAARGEK